MSSRDYIRDNDPNSGPVPECHALGVPVPECHVIERDYIRDDDPNSGPVPECHVLGVPVPECHVIERDYIREDDPNSGPVQKGKKKVPPSRLFSETRIHMIPTFERMIWPESFLGKEREIFF